MAQAANETHFAQPHWRLIAQGFDTEAWFNDGQAKGTGGIFNPRRYELGKGLYYYRFASSSATPQSRLGGGWWLDFANFRQVESFAKDNGYSIRDAARLMLALPYAWTRVDTLVRALLTTPLLAYAGQGLPARGGAMGADRGTRWIPTQHIKIQQLYIPGLYVEGPRHKDQDQLYRKVFAQVRERSLL